MADFQSPFPESPRTFFTPNPLVLALAQVRFPAILSIGSEPPAKFQEEIREDFPIYRERQGITVQFTQPPFGPQTEVRTRVFDFGTPDGTLIITLSQDFLSFQTTNYERWETYRATLEQCLVALTAIYRPAFFSRVGLRYQNLIIRSKLGLEGSLWKTLLNPAIAAELSTDNFEPMILERLTNITMRLNQSEDRVTINHGLLPNQENEQCYLIDADFYSEGRFAPNSAIQSFDALKRHSGRFFRWAISDSLAQAMAPEVVE